MFITYNSIWAIWYETTVGYAPKNLFAAMPPIRLSGQSHQSHHPQMKQVGQAGVFFSFMKIAKGFVKVPGA